MRPNRNREGLFKTPSFSQSTSQTATSNLQFSSPSRKRHGIALIGERGNGSTIISLFFRSTPFAIRCPLLLHAFFTFTTRIITINIKTLYRQFGRRFFTHISQKERERMPALANRNSSASVIFISHNIGIVATRMHRIPRSKKRVVTQAVTIMKAANFFFLQTAATFSRSIAQMSALYASNFSTNTFTPPLAIACISKDSKPSKHLARQIQKTRILGKRLKNNGIFVVGHFFSLIENLIRVVQGVRLVQPFYSVTI